MHFGRTKNKQFSGAGCELLIGHGPCGGRDKHEAKHNSLGLLVDNICLCLPNNTTGHQQMWVSIAFIPPMSRLVCRDTTTWKSNAILGGSPIWRETHRIATLSIQLHGFVVDRTIFFAKARGWCRAELWCRLLSIKPENFGFDLWVCFVGWVMLEGETSWGPFFRFPGAAFFSDSGGLRFFRFRGAAFASSDWTRFLFNYSKV